MSTEKTQALVIRLADFSESSRVVTLFTRDFGKISAVAKGAKRLKGPFEAALDLLTRCEVVFIRKSSSGLDILTEAKLTKRFQPSAGRLPNLYAGYYVAELLDALSEEYDTHVALYDEAVSTLDRLSDESAIDQTILRFELVTLREIGQLPSFDACVNCGEPVGPPKRYGFKASHGGLICTSCLGEEAARYEVTAGTAAVLRTFAGDAPAAWQRVEPTPGQKKEIRAVVNSTIAHILGRRPKMMKYLPL